MGVNFSTVYPLTTHPIMADGIAIANTPDEPWEMSCDECGERIDIDHYNDMVAHDEAHRTEREEAKAKAVQQTQEILAARGPDHEDVKAAPLFKDPMPTPKYEIGQTVTFKLQPGDEQRHGKIEESKITQTGRVAYLIEPVGWILEQGVIGEVVAEWPLLAAKIKVGDIVVNETDMVNHPPHYQSGKFEVIEVLEEFFADDPLLWQVGKYIMRAGKKGDLAEDLKKARWYLDRRISKEEQ